MQASEVDAEVHHPRALCKGLRAERERALVDDRLAGGAIEVPNKGGDLQAFPPIEPNLRLGDVDREILCALMPAVELEVRYEAVASALDEVRPVDVAAPRREAARDRPNNANRPANHPAPTLAFGHEKPRWVFDRPSTTIVGSFRPDVVAAPNYRTSTARQDQTGSVRVTVAEAGVLQGFPYDYPWTGSRTAQYQQVGNAIPPPLAEAVVRTLTQM